MSSLQDQRRRELTTAVLPAVCSMFVPGSGQLMSNRRAKAVRLFGIAAGLAVGMMTVLALEAPPPLPAVFAIPLLLTHVYAAIDAFRHGRSTRHV